MMFPKHQRFSSPVYIRWVKEQPCVNCDAPAPSDPHHVKGVGNFSGGGMTAGDNFAMPLCRKCHTLLHNGVIPLIEQWKWLAKTAARAIVEIIEGRLK